MAGRSRIGTRPIDRLSARVAIAPPNDSSPMMPTSGSSLAVFGSRPLVPAVARWLPDVSGRGAGDAVRSGGAV